MRYCPDDVSCVKGAACHDLCDELNYIEKDQILIEFLSSVGNQIGGYQFTKCCNESEYEKGKWDDVLKNRKNRLNEDIDKLIKFIKETY